jgi:hypothetical protein
MLKGVQKVDVFLKIQEIGVQKVDVFLKNSIKIVDNLRLINLSTIKIQIKEESEMVLLFLQ